MSTISELLVPRYEKEFNPGDITEETEDKIAKDIGADSIIYMTHKGLVDSIGLGKDDICMACLNGDYPTEHGKRIFKEECKRCAKGIKATKRSYEA
jgi:amidophosphoribosyltransferase